MELKVSYQSLVYLCLLSSLIKLDTPYIVTTGPVHIVDLLNFLKYGSMLLLLNIIPNYFSSLSWCSAVERFFNRKGAKKTGNNLHLETNKMPEQIRKIKIKMRTYENIKNEVKDEVKTKTAPSDILHWKVEDKDELRTSENVSLKIKMRTSGNLKDEVKDAVKTKSKTAPSDIMRWNVENIDKDELRTSENVSPFKKMKIVEEKSTIGHSSNSQMKDEFDEKEESRHDESVKPTRKVTEVTERPNAVSF